MPKIFNKFLLSLFVLLIFSCKDNNAIPKPIGNIRLSYPANKYKKLAVINSPFVFNNSIYTQTTQKEKPGWFNINYPNLKATLYITYYPVRNNLYEIIKDTEKLTFDKHTIKATEIKGQPYENKEEKVYGTLFRLAGNTATNLQFYLTDSTKHFVSGSLYFRVRPNYDSLLPAIDYIEKDVKTIMETIKWR